MTRIDGETTKYVWVRKHQTRIDARIKGGEGGHTLDFGHVVLSGGRNGEKYVCVSKWEEKTRGRPRTRWLDPAYKDSIINIMTCEMM